MSKHASELTLEELSEAGDAAATRALAEAFEHGLAVTGLMEDEKGRLRLARRYPDGAVEWIDSEPATLEDEAHASVKFAG